MGQSITTPVADTHLDHTQPWPLDHQGSLRWLVDVHAWHPRAIEWRFLCTLLPRADVLKLEKFRKLIDRKRALVSRLMQRRCIAVALDVPDETVVIARTKGSKPFDATPRAESAAAARRPNFNFNVSHEGGVVVLASDPVLLIGVDVSAPFELREGPHLGDFAKVRETFDAVVASDEWDLIEAEASDPERVKAFRRQWSRKESLVKARGDGLAFALQRARFHPSKQPAPPLPLDFCAQPAPTRGVDYAHTSADADADAIVDRSSAGAAASAFVSAPTFAPASAAAPASSEGASDDEANHAALGSLPGTALPLAPPIFALVHIDDEDDMWTSFVDAPSATWRCSTHELSGGHIASITRGPVAKAVDAHGAFRATFARPTLPDGELRARLAQPPIPFRQLRLRELVPPEQRPAYDTIILAQVQGVPIDALPDRPSYTPSEPPPDPPHDAPSVPTDTVPGWFNAENVSGGGGFHTHTW